MSNMDELSREEKIIISRQDFEREKRYLAKIGNDVDEKLYDLLLVHLIDVHKKVKPYGIYDPETDRRMSNGGDLVLLLDRAISDLNKKLNNYNRLRFYRFIIVLCNKILKYDTKRQDLKDMKMKIVKDYIHSEESSGEKIPLNYQINELRITYDTGYIEYLVNLFIEQELWNKALYCLIALGLIEPDHPYLKEWKEEIHKNTAPPCLTMTRFYNPENTALCLDSNIVIEWLEHYAFNHANGSREYYLPGRYVPSNTLVITPSVVSEVGSYLDYRYSRIHYKYRDRPQSIPDKMCKDLKDVFRELCSKYACPPISTRSVLLEEIKDFYAGYTGDLERILLSKLGNDRISYKLRKLAQREDLLPETGDMDLLAEAVELGGELEVAILTRDKDFIVFSREIFRNFNVKVYHS